MRVLPFAFVTLLLTGCVTPSQLMSSPVAYTVQSAKAPRQLANCIADTMTSATVQDNGDGSFTVIRTTTGGTAIGRWDVYPTSSGSRGEWRRHSSLATGGGAGDKCA